MVIKAIIGLGNPGPAYRFTRHNIGFLVAEALAEKWGASWRLKGEMEVAEAEWCGNRVILIRPQTFMNASGRVIPFLAKQGIKPEEILVIHDELEFPFGKVALRMGGSARGHNGLKSIIASMGDQFQRMRCGIGRPDDKNKVPQYVLQPFAEGAEQVETMVSKAVEELEKLCRF